MLGRKKKMTSKKYVFIGVVILIIILLIIFSFTLKEDRKLNPVESFLRDTLSYAEKIVTYPFSYITTKTREYNKLKDVNEENDILETSLDRIDAIETENVELRRQIDALKNELNIDYTLTDYEYLNAKDVDIGDFVYTSGLGGIFPSGILIGSVSEITTDSYDLAKIIKVKPSADFSNINYVSVLKRKDSE